MVSSIRLAGALAAPLLLAGCGLPVGVQIASLLADGVSVLATEKTLTDHGLSAVTNQDCALWRGVEGQDICRAADDSTTTLAEAAATSKAKDTATQRDWGAADAAAQENKNIARREIPEFPTEDPAAPAVAPSPSPVGPAPVETAALDAPAPQAGPTPQAGPAPVDAFTASWAPVTSVAAEKPAAPALKPVPVKLVRKPNVAPKASKRKTYYVIASYHRAAGAERFAGRHKRLEPVVLEGTAKGRRVFRVAIGPIAREGRKTTKLFLKNRGFGDAWALSVTAPKPATEVASLR